MPVKSKAHRACVQILFPPSTTSLPPKIAKLVAFEAPITLEKPPTTPCGHSHECTDDVAFDPDLVETIKQFDSLKNNFPDLYDPVETDGEEHGEDKMEIQEISTLEHFAKI
jgi:hypothetical protein